MHRAFVFVTFKECIFPRSMIILNISREIASKTDMEIINWNVLQKLFCAASRNYCYFLLSHWIKPWLNYSPNAFKEETRVYDVHFMHHFRVIVLRDTTANLNKIFNFSHKQFQNRNTVQINNGCACFNFPPCIFGTLRQNNV